MDEHGEALATGARVRCERCGAEAVLVKAQVPALSCCDGPMNVVSPGPRRP